MTLALLDIVPRANPALKVRALLLLAVLVLAIEPVRWLWRTWTDAAYVSDGWMVALLTLAIAGWSVSARPAAGGRAPQWVFACLLATALIRLAAEILDINVVGGLTLVIDVYALAHALGLDRRARAVSPFWLAVLFALSLPLEHMLQRAVGYGLQMLSAKAACGLLGLYDPAVACDGIRILLRGRDLLVDLPCSGSRGLVGLGVVFAGLAAVKRPGWAMAAVGIALALAAALAGNALRIALLAIGEDRGFAVLAEPWHSGIGLVTLSLSAALLFAWGRRVRPAAVSAPRFSERPARIVPTRGVPVWAAALLLAAGLLLPLVKARPVDVSAPMPPVTLPAVIGDRPATADPLSAREAEYFTLYGGAAARARYGVNTLMLVRTTAPLRHLHAPDDCLRALGYRIRHVGTRFEPVPTAYYRAEAPDGGAWRIAVSFRSDDGTIVTSLSQAVWLWIGDRRRAWSLIERVTPWDAPAGAADAWDSAVFRSLDINPQGPSS